MQTRFSRTLLPLLFASMAAACSQVARLPVSAGSGADPALPAPEQRLFPTVHVAPAKGWPPGLTPVAAPGLQVTRFADRMEHPRWLHVLPNGDVLVAEANAPHRPEDNKGIRAGIIKRTKATAGAGVPSADRISLLRDTDGDGVADQRSVLLDGLNSPFGMALVGDTLYVANADALVRFPYRPGQTRITSAGVKLIDLPGGPINHHWTKNLIASADGRRLYVAVGSNSNIGENGLDNETDRAAIWEVDANSGAYRVFASGLRNPVGLDWEPERGSLWVTVNERDELGSDLVPDYLTAVREGGFYGWPYSYFGQHVDTRVQPTNVDLVARAIVPDYALGPHTASLGLAFARGNALPESLQHGAFVGQHGSWNRRPYSGYKVIYVPFRGGRPVGKPIDVLTGFLSDQGEAYGRPVGVAIDRRGALLVADDVGNAVWRVAASR